MLADGTYLRDKPLFKQLAADIDAELIPPLLDDGFEIDDEHPSAQRSGKKYFSWCLYKRATPEVVIWLNVTASQPSDPLLNVYACAYRLEDPDLADEKALAFVHRQMASRMRDRRRFLVGGITLFERHLSPYRRYRLLGLAPLRIFYAIKPRRIWSGVTMLTILFPVAVLIQILCYPIRRFFAPTELSWLNAGPSETLAVRKRAVAAILSEVPGFGQSIEGLYSRVGASQAREHGV